MRRNFISALAAIFVGAGAGVMTPSSYPTTIARAAQNNWANEAEQTFHLGRGAGRQLMTQEEWREHQQKMKSMSRSEKEKYRAEWHEKMRERAREKGITLPETPRPGRGAGPGNGRGPGGPGSGRGPGGGR
jgi:1,2-phenylacetyl-CoA epoxidase catalytic subunit